MLHDMKGESLPENDLLKTLASNVVSHKDVEAEGLALVPVIIVNRFEDKMILTFLVEIELFVHECLHFEE